MIGEYSNMKEKENTGKETPLKVFFKLKSEKQT